MSTTALYTKNVPIWERLVRILLAVGGVVMGLTVLHGMWSWVVAASSIGLSLTGLVGYCPACAMVGRRL